MTPNDIYTKKFDKAVSGYKAEDVNRFLIVMGDSLAELLAERDDLEDKLEILAEKLEEYRADEESLRAAIVGAQKLGDSVVKDSRQKAETILLEAKQKAEQLIAEAREKAETMLDDTRRSIETEQYALDRIKAAVIKFRRQVMSMYERQVQTINAIPFDDDDATEPEPPEHLRRKEAREKPEEEPEAVKKAALDYEDLPQEDGEESATGEPKRRQSHFGPLLFGDDFNLTRKD